MKTNNADINRLELSDLEFEDVNILIVEDNSVCERFYKSLLMDYGFKVDTAVNGKKALDKINKNNYNIILMDIMMPEMDGYETAEKIRELPEPKNKLPIIAITSLPSIDKIKMKEMDEIITKPFNHIQLIRTIDMVMSMKDNIDFKEPIPLAEESIPERDERFKHINLKQLKNLSAGNPNFLIEMIDMFISQNKEALLALKTHLEDENWAEVRPIVHKMIMSLHIMGIVEMEKLATDIEKSIDQEENMQQLPDKVSKLIKLGNEALLELKVQRENIEAESSS